MENHVVHQQMPEIYVSSEQGSKYKRTLWPEKMVTDLRHALDPVLACLGQPQPTYNITDGGEAVVTVQTRMGLQQYSSDNSASSIEVKKWMAVSRALERILREEGMEVRDPSHTDLLWTCHAYQAHLEAMVLFREELKGIQRQIVDLIAENK